MIELGVYDDDVSAAALEAYIDHAKTLTGVRDWDNRLRGEAEAQWIPFQKASQSDLRVTDVQRFLKNAGFFPEGLIDGICGYRTTSAIRLFQEYVRTVGGIGDFYPDGRFGPRSRQHMIAWTERRADWCAFSSANPIPGFALWMELLARMKEKYRAEPSALLRLVNKDRRPSATVKVDDWDFDPSLIHLIGIRRNETATISDAANRPFDDVFVLLIRGLTFVFRGSTDPGKTSRAAPFLVQGQHRYRFGWHKLADPKVGRSRAFHALKPAGDVLIVRSQDTALTDDDLAKGLELNASINVHWGGEGRGTVGRWSEGCQVIVGSGYVNHVGTAIDCSDYAAPAYGSLGKSNARGIYQTKGAYTVLGDLVAALSGADPNDNIVRYTLIYERDLALHPDIGVEWPRGILASLGS